MIKLLDILNEDIINGEIECEKCGWKWKVVDGGQEPYICHKCDHDNSNLQLQQELLVS